MTFVVFFFLLVWHADLDAPAPPLGAFASSLAPGLVVTAVLAIGGVYLILAIRALCSSFVASSAVYSRLP
jgi:hypothetical protein